MKEQQIKQERLKRYWTQGELAEKAGFHRSQICEWEAGKRNPSLKNQKRLKQTFDENPIT